jgi:hypothetical protein
MAIKIAKNKQPLKQHQTGRPNMKTSAIARKEQFPCQRFEAKQQKSPEESKRRE